MILIGRHLSLLLLATISSSSFAQYLPGGYQTGPFLDGSVYASAATVDKNDGTLIVTGASYSDTMNADNPATSPSDITDCFIAVASLPNAYGSVNDDIVLEQVQVLHTGYEGTQQTSFEMCSAVLKHNSKLLLAGYSGFNRTGTVHDLYIQGQFISSAVLGVLTQIDYQSLTGNDMNVVGGKILQDTAVNYPTALFGRPGDDYIYVAAQESSSRNAREGMEMTQGGSGTSIINLADPFQHFQYGDLLTVRISQLSWRENLNNLATNAQETLDSGWEKLLGTTDFKDVYVAGITEMDNAVIVVGSTAGTGSVFDKSEDDQTDTSLDGFITKLSTSNGAWLGDSASGVVDPGTPARRIASIPGKNDQIMSLCTGNTATADHFYIAGWTSGYFTTTPPGSTGNPSIQGFLLKIQVDTLEIIWSYQVGADTETGGDTIVAGIACAVTQDDGEVWLAGNVYDDALLNEKDLSLDVSYGGSDVFVVKVNATSGSPIFARQLGSSSNDEVAARNGLNVDIAGNAVLTGNTYGSLYRQRSEAEENAEDTSADFFIATISRADGKLKIPIEAGGDIPIVTTAEPEVTATDSPTPTPTQPPVETQPESPAPPDGPPETPEENPEDTTSDNNDTPDDNTSDKNAQPPFIDQPPAGNDKGNVNVEAPEKGDDDGHNQTRWASLIATLCLLSVLVLVGSVYVSQHINYKDVHTDRGKVLNYIGDFDVEDIDLKHSATGGWHCSYTNDLAEGKNRKNFGISGSDTGSDDDPLSQTASLATLSQPESDRLLSTGGLGDGRDGIVKDFLFMDDDNSPETFGARSKRPSGYDGLMEAYNSTWDQTNRNTTKSTNPWGKDIV